MSRKGENKADKKTLKTDKTAKTNTAKQTATPVANNKPTANTAAAANTNHGADATQPGTVIPFRQPGWDKNSPYMNNEQKVKAAQGGFAPVAQRFNHSRGK